MRTLRSWFQPLNGKNLTLEALWAKIEGMIVRHCAQLPPDFGSRQLFEYALNRHWIRERSNGQLIVSL